MQLLPSSLLSVSRAPALLRFRSTGSSRPLCPRLRQSQPCSAAARVCDPRQPQRRRVRLWHDNFLEKTRTPRFTNLPLSLAETRCVVLRSHPAASRGWNSSRPAFSACPFSSMRPAIARGTLQQFRFPPCAQDVLSWGMSPRNDVCGDSGNVDRLGRHLEPTR